MIYVFIATVVTGIIAIPCIALLVLLLFAKNDEETDWE